jgi:protein-tyrosine phosphatase
MDRTNLSYLKRLCPGTKTLFRLLDFAPAITEEDIPDPYYGGPEEFERVVDLIEQASQALFQVLKARAGAG